MPYYWQRSIILKAETAKLGIFVNKISQSQALAFEKIYSKYGKVVHPERFERPALRFVV